MQLTSQSFTFEGRTRSYVLHRGGNSPQWNGPAPQVVVGFHGGGGSGAGFATNFERHANDGIWFLFPDAEVHAGEPRWVALGDPVQDTEVDARFVTACRGHVITACAAQGIPAPVDWYACGFSSGGKMTHHLAILHGEDWVAFAPSSKSLDVAMSAIALAHPRPVLFTCGTSDPGNYLPEPGNHVGALNTAEYWRTALKRGAAFVPTSAMGTKATTERRVYVEGTCGPGPQFIHNNVLNGTHAWYGKKPHGAHQETEVIDFFVTYAGLR